MGGGGHLKVPQVGRVIIQDDVEIGAGTTIDRGAIRDTVIGEGTKIDNLVQVGHNVSIGRHCMLVAQTGISGSFDAGRLCRAGRAASASTNNVTIGEGAQIAASSIVHRRCSGRRALGRHAGQAGEAMVPRDDGACAACARGKTVRDNPAAAGERLRRWTWMSGHKRLEAADIAAVLKMLPHRYPFLMVDRVIDIRGDEMRHRHQERHLQRAAFPGPFSRQSGVSRRADDRGHGADRRACFAFCATSSTQPKSVLFPDHRQGEIPQAGAARRHHRISHDAHRPAQDHVVVPRRGQSRRPDRRRSRGRRHADRQHERAP